MNKRVKRRNSASVFLKLKIISVLIPLFTMIVCFSITDPYFLTNDDPGIQDTLAGCVTGTPYPYHQFINCLLGFVICSFYRIIPSVPWWWLTEISICLIGVSFFNYGILNIFYNFAESHEKKINAFLLSIVLISIIDFVFFGYNVILVSFTVSPVIISSGGIVLLFLYANLETKQTIKIPLYVGFIVVFSSLIRFETGLVCICFYFLGLLYYILKVNTNKNINYFIKITFCFFLMSILTFSLSSISNSIQDSKNPDNFRAFNNARAKFMGYPHLEYDDDPEFFESKGFYREKYKLVTFWCFLDPDVTENFFTTILKENPPEHIQSINISETSTKTEPTVISIENSKKTLFERIRRLTLKKIIKWIWSFSASSYRRVFVIIAIFYSFTPFFIIILNKKLFSIDFIVSLLTVIGMWAMVCYLKMQGRTPSRALLTCIIPMVFINSFLLFLTFLKSSGIIRSKLFYILNFVLIFYSCVGISFGIRESINRKEYSLDLIKVIDYVNNSNNLFIYDFSFSSKLPFINMPINLIPWGGSCWKSNIEKTRCDLLNIASIDLNIFKNDNVYFISQKEDNFKSLFTVLSKEYGCKGYKFEKITDNSNIMIYDFEY
ncbi:MAG: hypothetical protein IKZ86_11420 [Spirochaetaceae bacterium]|nr:hypothetical protein [Spirochaetaceae bacterium]